jgi:deoxyribodipyrimidine photolyase-related protein
MRNDVCECPGMPRPVLVLFPHQLFRSNADLAHGKNAVLVEDALYFRQYAFHKQKLVLHRASMRRHAVYLEAAGVPVTYIDSDSAQSMRTVVERIAQLQPGAVHYIDAVDDWLERRLKREAKRAGFELQRHETPMFLNSTRDLEDYFRDRPRMFMADFYAAQRKQRGILMDGNKPLGGRWSFDDENRKRMPKTLAAPVLWRPASAVSFIDSVTDSFVTEAAEYVDRHFAANPGSVRDFAYPTTYEEADRWLDDFVQNRLAQFGDYEDAIVARESTLFHSVLSPLLNVGLLTPQQVLDAALGARGIPLNSLEGFVRQIIGWREFVRASYVLRGRKQRTQNFWHHERELPKAFWTASTGLDPADAVIARVLKTAYAHHIERLMVLGNLMQLCGFRPDDVYRWFMELFIDAYDWVMVPNVYGMALYADGGLITTKPYLSGSSYLRKMSDFPRGPWCDTWDALFWTFLSNHRAVFERNQRLGVLTRQLDRMPEEKLQTHRAETQKFLTSLDRGSR